MTQSPEQRKDNLWSFTKYDDHNRVIVTGEFSTNLNISTIRTQSKLSTYKRYEISKGQSQIGYTLNRSYPIVAEEDASTMMYFDNYSFLTYSDWDLESHIFAFELNEDHNLFGFSGLSNTTNVLGQQTGSKIKNPNNGMWFNSVIYYDNDFNILQERVENHLGGIDIVTNHYNELRQLDKSLTIHNNGINEIVWLQEFEFDHAGRAINAFHQFKGGNKILAQNNRYNELGGLVEKNLHSTDEGVNFIQSIDYRYDIRGNLTHINNASLTVETGINDDDNDVFGMELEYFKPEEALIINGNRIEDYYDGNIRALKWASRNPNFGVVQKVYGFHYDEMGRFINGWYSEKEESSWTGNVGMYDVEVTGYDGNGNILGLNRFGFWGGNKTAIDILSYTYTNGNQLNHVSDGVVNNSEGFIDGYKASGDYAYDDNGNMIYDLNKSITKIEYSSYNLPTDIEFSPSNGGTKNILYQYDASGAKIKKIIKDGNTILNTTDYLPGVQYDNGQLSFVNTPGGRAIPLSNGTYQYEYFITDHQNNTRAVVVANKTEVVHEFLADFESSSSGEFINYSRANVGDMFNHTVETATTVNPSFAQRLIGSVGTGKVLEVNAGDRISLETHVKYLKPVNSSGAIQTIVSSAVAYAFGITSINGYEGSVIESFNQGANSTFSSISTGSYDLPKASLVYMLFDNDFKLIQFGFENMGYEANGKFQKLSLESTMPVDGKLYTYVVNMNAPIEVYFDDFKVTHKTFQDAAFSVNEITDYYPFGLTHKGSV